MSYRSRNAAFAAFVAANPRQTEVWGLNVPASGGEFDAVNERYGLRGPKRITTLRGAIMACIAPGRPWTLATMDLDTLNETAPAWGVAPFVLPDADALERCDGLPVGFDPYDIADDAGTVMFDTRAFARAQQRAARKTEGDAAFRLLMSRVRREMPMASAR